MLNILARETGLSVDDRYGRLPTRVRRRLARRFDAATQSADPKPELHTTSTGATVTTVAIASSRRGSDEDPVYVDLVLWDAQAAFAVEHLVKGQAVSFAGRLAPRAWTDRDANQRVAIEVHGVELEYGPKPRAAGGDRAAEVPA